MEEKSYADSPFAAGIVDGYRMEAPQAGLVS